MLSSTTTRANIHWNSSYKHPPSMTANARLTKSQSDFNAFRQPEVWQLGSRREQIREKGS